MTAPAERVAEPWELLSERPRTGGWLPVVTRTYRMPDGSVSDWDVHKTPFTTVCVLALTTEGDVVLTRQFRPGPGVVVHDLPGGIVDEGESLTEAALRELREETGWAAERAELVGSSWAFGASTWRRNVVVAYDARPVGDVTSWGGEEYCEPIVLSVAEFREVLRKGNTTEADLGYLALDAAGLLC